jgi:hypothetical protein
LFGCDNVLVRHSILHVGSVFRAASEFALRGGPFFIIPHYHSRMED